MWFSPNMIPWSSIGRWSAYLACWSSTMSMILGMTGNQRASIQVILLKTSAGSRDPCYKMASADLKIPGRLHGGSLSKGVLWLGFATASGRSRDPWPATWWFPSKGVLRPDSPLSVEGHIPLASSARLRGVTSRLWWTKFLCDWHLLVSIVRQS
jgi:hypothetical protein